MNTWLAANSKYNLKKISKNIKKVSSYASEQIK